jgi:hypothetical protein
MRACVCVRACVREHTRFRILGTLSPREREREGGREGGREGERERERERGSEAIAMQVPVALLRRLYNLLQLVLAMDPRP